MLELGGMNVAFQKAQGPYFYDDEDNRYLDLLSGGGVYFIGRNHPNVREAIRDVNEMDIPNLSVVNSSVLGGLLAEKLVEMAGPGFSKVSTATPAQKRTKVAIRFAFCTRKRRFFSWKARFMVVHSARFLCAVFLK